MDRTYRNIWCLVPSKLLAGEDLVEKNWKRLRGQFINSLVSFIEEEG